MVDYHSSGRDSVEIRLDERPAPAPGRPARATGDDAAQPKSGRLRGAGFEDVEEMYPGWHGDGMLGLLALFAMICGVLLFPLGLSIAMLAGYGDMNDGGSLLEAKATCTSTSIQAPPAGEDTMLDQIVSTEALEDALNCMKILAILMMSSFFSFVVLAVFYLFFL